MTQNLKYLTDEELELLTADVEQNDLVMAPPDLLEEILECINETEPHAEMNGGKSKQNVGKPTKSATNIREFRRYCFRICASVAAAVFLIFALPAMSDNLAAFMPRQDEFAVEQKYATKEEALNDGRYLTQKFGGTNIFSSNREIGIFKQ